MFEKLKDFKKIIVTGPQRSGTRFVAKCIANGLGLKYIDEVEFNTHDEKLFKNILKQDNIVVHCPAMTHICHKFDVAVMFVRRPIKEIIESQKKIDWDKRNIVGELAKYGKKKGNIAEVKYNAWDNWQKKLCKYPFEINYHDLEEHPLWVGKKKRDDLRASGKWIWKSTK